MEQVIGVERSERVTRLAYAKKQFTDAGASLFRLFPAKFVDLVHGCDVDRRLPEITG